MKELVKIQHELKAPKGQFNSFGKYKYRNCEDILEALKPLLKEQECYLTLSDTVEEVGNILMIKATATITNAEDKTVSVVAFAGIDPNKKGMDISQTFGSSSSYARKYALNGLFAIDDTKDADSEEPKAKTTTTSTKPTMDFSSQSFINCKNAFIEAKTAEAEKAIIDKVTLNYSNASEVIEKVKKLKIANKL